MLDYLLASIKDHPTAWTMGTYYCVSNAISALPSPDSTSGKGYRWIFDFSHLVAGNISRIIATRYPQVQGGKDANPNP